MNPKEPGTVTDQQFEYLRQLVLERSGLSLEPTKKYLLDVRLSGIAREQGTSGVGALLENLRTVGGFTPVHRSVVEAMTTNETYFFRDVHPFDVLQKQLVPEFLAKRATRRALRIWSAAASTGQEAYSIAMLLAEHFPQLSSWNVDILGTDLASGVISVAKAGRYTQLEVNRGLPASYLVKYFVPEGTHWQVKDSIRRMTRFQLMNLTALWPVLGTFDIVFIRNVLIYFNPETKREILNRVHHVLEPDGVMFMGGAETTLGLTEQFEPIMQGRTTLYRPRAKPPSTNPGPARGHDVKPAFCNLNPRGAYA